MAKNIDYNFKRGDTQVLKKFKLLDANKQEVILTASEELYFTVKKNTKTLAYLLQKKLGEGIELGDDGYYHITIDPQDTNSLDYGEYVYDIELKSVQNNNVFVRTFLEGTITLEDEVTWGGNE